MGRSLALASVIALAACGGGSRACKDGTVFLTIDYQDATAAAEDVLVTVTVAGAPQSYNWPRKAGGLRDTLEIDFPKGYPQGASISVSAEATVSGASIGSGSVSGRLDGTCQALELQVVGLSRDAAVTDAMDAGMRDDGAGNDLACMAGTLAITIDYVGVTRFADTALVQVDYNGFTHSLPFTHVQGDAQQVALALLGPPYPSGESATVTVTAQDGSGNNLGNGATTVTLKGPCDAVEVQVEPSPDGGIDAATSD